MRKGNWLLVLIFVVLAGCTAKTSGAVESPFPKISDPYPPAKAAANGDVVNAHEEMHNVDKWKLFLENLRQKNPDQVRITQYTVEGDPIFYELVYEEKAGISFTLDNSMDAYGKDEKRPSTHCKGIREERSKIGTTYTLTGCDSSSRGERFHFVVPLGEPKK